MTTFFLLDREKTTSKFSTFSFPFYLWPRLLSSIIFIPIFVFLFTSHPFSFGNRTTIFIIEVYITEYDLVLFLVVYFDENLEKSTNKPDSMFSSYQYDIEETVASTNVRWHKMNNIEIFFSSIEQEKDRNWIRYIYLKVVFFFLIFHNNFSYNDIWNGWKNEILQSILLISWFDRIAF